MNLGASELTAVWHSPALRRRRTDCSTSVNNAPYKQCSSALRRRATRGFSRQNSEFLSSLGRFLFQLTEPFWVHVPGSPGANEFVPVSCHCLAHLSTQGHKAAKGVGALYSAGCRKAAGSDPVGRTRKQWLFFFFLSLTVCISRGLWCMALAFIPVFRCWMYLAILLVVFNRSPSSCPQHFPFLCLTLCIATVNCLGWWVLLLTWSLWMLLTSNCWKSLFKHRTPTLFF